MSVKVPRLPQSFRTIKNIRIGLRDPIESSYTAQSLPTSETANNPWSRTLSTSDFPTLEPSTASATWIARLDMVGQNTSGSAVTLNWRMLKNGNTVATSSTSVSASNFYRIFCTWLGVAVNDVLELRMWGSATGLNHDFVWFQIHPTRVAEAEAGGRLTYSTFSGLVIQPTYITANAPSGSSTDTGFSIQHGLIPLTAARTTQTSEYLVQSGSFGLFRTAYGDTTAPVDTASTATGTARSGLTRLRSWIPTVITLVIYNAP